MSSDSAANRIRDLELYNINDKEEIAVLKFLIKRGSAEFKKPGKTKAERDKIASVNMNTRKKLGMLINEIKYRNAEIANLQDTSL
jgi:hypothetical protein